MVRRMTMACAVALLFGLVARPAGAQRSASGAWTFVASGDSRNCGDVVMPGIAETAKKNHAAFYWHLGDLRAIYAIDEDILHQPEIERKVMDRSEPERQHLAGVEQMPEICP